MKYLTLDPKIKVLIDNPSASFDVSNPDQPILFVPKDGCGTREMASMLASSGVPCDQIAVDAEDEAMYAIALPPRSFYAIMMVSEGTNPSNYDELSDEQISFRMHLFKSAVDLYDESGEEYALGFMNGMLSMLSSH